MKTKTNNEAVNETITFFDKKVNNVIDVLYNYSLLNNLPECIKLDKNTQKQIIEDTINYYLTKIESLNMDDIEKKYYDIQEVTDYFSYSFNKKLKEKDKHIFNEIKESNKALPFSMQVSNNRILLSYLYLISIDNKLNGYIKRFVFSLFVFIINSFYDSISTF